VVVLDHHRHDAAAHVVYRVLVLGVLSQRIKQRLSAEHVVAHGRECLVRTPRQSRRIQRLLEESGHPLVRADIDDTEGARLGARYPDACDGGTRTGVDVLLHHLPRVHAVHVIGAEHHDVVRLLVVDQIGRLQDRVGAARVPPWAEPLLRRHGGDVVTDDGGHPPGLTDVPIQRVRLVLGEHADPQVLRVHQIGQHEIDQPIVATEWNGRLGAVCGERPQAFAFTTGEDYAEDARLAGHGLTLTRYQALGSRACEWQC